MTGDDPIPPSGDARAGEMRDALLAGLDADH